MKIQQGTTILTITGGYGIANDGTIHPGGCPDGIEGVNHPAMSGPLYTAEGRAELGVTDVVIQPRPNDRYWTVTDNADGTRLAIKCPRCGTLNVMKAQRLKQPERHRASIRKEMTDGNSKQDSQDAL